MNMASLPSPMQSMENCKVFQKNIGVFFFTLLLFSIILFLPTLFSSHSFTTFSQLEGDYEEEEEACDLFVGKWIRDFREPIYNNLTCPTLPLVKNCVKHGKDPNYIHWRWKPDGCELPRFDPSMFLNIVRRKKLAFIGDSLARNQFESLLCLLSQVESPENKHKDSQGRFQTWYFPSHNFTLMVIWTQFLVQANERIVNGSASDVFDIHLDKINSEWTNKLPGINFAIISTGNWFIRKTYLHKDDKLLGCTLCSDANMTDLGYVYAIKNALSTTLEFIRTCKECSEGMVTVLRTYTPSHFEHGSWFNGGYCNRTLPLSESELSYNVSTAWRIRKSQVEEFGKVIQSVEMEGKKKFVLLDVSKAMMFRADAHPDRHWLRWQNVNDCLHWCLPGPVDVWNELLMVVLRKHSMK
ncbi:hypothetical protein J5N97_026556 [Dioscorea zingiberensis]|uniref:Trichome birefringence-like N-terminal domain-containing protein n=1 Tax=Dioscorea zingiberensis TaxID=325984 RepID=A0A9D5H6T2_9LILI|nr:hypothetical protein J5N97_026556 [Dioscorea zingiberensis]